MGAERGRPQESMKHGLFRRCSTVFLFTKSMFFAVNSLSEGRGETIGQDKIYIYIYIKAIIYLYIIIKMCEMAKT